MATTLASLLPDLLGRIEENVESGPVFWSLVGECYPAMVQAEFEAALITGVVQASNVAVTLAANTTYFSIQNNVSIGIPKGMLAPLRLKAPYSIRKTTLRGLDSMYPAWQRQAPGTQLIAWFPLGVSTFGIYPQLTAESVVVMDFLQSPVNEYTPYTGAEVIPLQAEFTDLLSKYAAAYLRSKEGGQEADEAGVVFEEYLAEVKELSLFQSRLDALVYTAAYGAQSGVNPRKIV